MSKKSLAVDDSVSIRQPQSVVLRPAGCLVVEASGGREAQVKLTSNTVDLIGMAEKVIGW